MNVFLIIVFTIIILLYIYTHSPWGNLQRHLDGIEGVADRLYADFIENSNYSVEEYHTWDESRLKRIGSTQKEMSGIVLKHKKRVEDAKELYFKLKEKTKFSSEKERIEVYQDWLDYMKAVNEMEVPKEFREYGGVDIPEETFVESRAKMEMIEKRFKNKLA